MYTLIISKTSKSRYGLTITPSLNIDGVIFPHNPESMIIQSNVVSVFKFDVKQWMMNFDLSLLSDETISDINEQQIMQMKIDDESFDAVNSPFFKNGKLDFKFSISK